MQQLGLTVAALSHSASAGSRWGGGALTIFVPASFAGADIDWLVARIRAEDDEVVGVCKGASAIVFRRSKKHHIGYHLARIIRPNASHKAEGATYSPPSPYHPVAGRGGKPMKRNPGQDEDYPSAVPLAALGIYGSYWL